MMCGLFYSLMVHYNNTREYKKWKLKFMLNFKTPSAIDCLRIIQHYYDEINLYYNFSLFFCLFVFLSFCYFLGSSRGIWSFPGEGSNRSCSRWPTPEPQQRGIRGASATYTTAHGNARSLTH